MIVSGQHHDIELLEMKSDRRGKHRQKGDHGTARPSTQGRDSRQEGSASTHDDSAVMIFMEHQRRMHMYKVGTWKGGREVCESREWVNW